MNALDGRPVIEQGRTGVLALPDWNLVRERGARLSLSLARLAFIVMIVLIPFSFRTLLEARRFPPIYKDYTDFVLTASDVFMLAVLVLWGSSLVLAPRRIRFGPLWIAAPLAGLTLVAALSTIGSIDPALSLYHSARLVLLGALYLFVVNEVRSLSDLAVPVALQVVVQSAVGLAQFLQQHSVGLAALGELALDPAWKGVSIVWSGQSVLLRAYGLTDHPNILGGCLAFALVLLLYCYLNAGPRGRVLLASVISLGAVVLLLTFSRAAWLALAAGGALMLAWLAVTRQGDRIADALTVGAAAAILVLPFAWQNASFLGVRLDPAAPSMANGENRSAVERGVLNGAAAAILLDHPATGVGLGAFPLALKAAQPSFPFDYQPAHLAALEVAAETGVVGGLLYIVLLIAPWLALWQGRSRLRADQTTLALIGASAVLLALSVTGLFDYYTWVLAPGRLWQWLGWGVWGMAFQKWSGVADG